MSILNNCELWWPKLDPKRPNARFNKERPTWELQLRTSDISQKKQWEAEKLKVKTEVDEDTGKPVFVANLRKASIKSDGSAADPVEVLDGNLEALNPRRIGNGSIGNVRLFQYEFELNGTKRTASVLMGVQVTTLKEYVSKPIAEFAPAGDTKVIKPEGEDDKRPADADDY